MNSYAEATGAPFDIFFALCGSDLAVEDVLERSAMAIEVVAVRDETWTTDELDSALHVAHCFVIATKSIQPPTEAIHDVPRVGPQFGAAE